MVDIIIKLAVTIGGVCGFLWLSGVCLVYLDVKQKLKERPQLNKEEKRKYIKKMLNEYYNHELLGYSFLFGMLAVLSFFFALLIALIW
jgi:hypothetical protein